MVSVLQGLRDVALLWPTDSLVLQLAQWARGHHRMAIRAVWPGMPDLAEQAMERAAFSVVDATNHPADATSIVQHAVAQGWRDKLLIYTEFMHKGMEIMIRSQGVVVLLGPMSDEQWESTLLASIRISENSDKTYFGIL